MRKIKLNHITLSEETFPIYCDLFVLSKIQDRMSINEFERNILGAAILRDSDGNPQYDENNRIKLYFDKYDINTILFGLALMINEGIAIENEQDGKNTEEVTEEYLGRLSNKTLKELSDIVHENFNRCFESKKNEVTETKAPTSRKKKTTR